MSLVAVMAAVVALAAFVARDGAPLDGHTRSWVRWLAAVAFAAGGVCRLYGFDRSLWIDEFGTLWTVEGTLGQAIERALAFHGQSPFYYVTLWPLVHIAGESEVILRVPSLLCSIAATWFIGRTAAALASVEAGLLAAALAWMAPVMMEASVNARAYAMATMFAAMAACGFTLAVTSGRWTHRLLFVAGGAGLFLTQYVSSLIMIGLGLGYLFARPLRGQYRPRQFAFDVVAQAAVVAAAVPQIAALWRRRDALDWIGPPNYLVFAGVLAPFVVAWGTAAVRAERPATGTVRSLERCLLVGILAQVVLLSILAAGGTNLLAPRYLMVIVAPAAILAGPALSRLRTPAALVSVVFAVALAVAASAMAWRVNGLLTTVPNQDWRTAVPALDGALRARPDAFVLYRPGFVEQDPARPAAAALLAPLRSPGRRLPAWPLVPLTFSWATPSREEYFRDTIRPRVSSTDVFFLLNSGMTPRTGDYARLLLAWIDEQFPGEFVVRPVVPLVGIDLLRFDRVRPRGAER